MPELLKLPDQCSIDEQGVEWVLEQWVGEEGVARVQNFHPAHAAVLFGDPPTLINSDAI